MTKQRFRSKRVTPEVYKKIKVLTDAGLKTRIIRDNNGYSNLVINNVRKANNYMEYVMLNKPKSKPKETEKKQPVQLPLSDDSKFRDSIVFDVTMKLDDIIYEQKETTRAIYILLAYLKSRDTSAKKQSFWNK
jgi:hypothetical protein